MREPGHTRPLRAGAAEALAVGLLLAAVACGSAGGDGPDPGSEGWSRVDVGGVLSLSLPPELRLRSDAGADSLVREWASDALVLSLDYGRFSNPLDDVGGGSARREPISLDGREALLVRYRDPRDRAGLEYVAALHVPDVGAGSARLTLFARAASEGGRERAVRILRSLRFAAD